MSAPTTRRRAVTVERLLDAALQTFADTGSLHNTPPCWGIYMCGLVFKWIKETGGLTAMAERNREKAGLLYDAIDQSSLFRGFAQREHRSIMNVTFTTGSEETDAAFVKAATAAGFVGLKGHRSLGGLRASLYNAVPRASVEALADFMRSYESSHNSSCPCSCPSSSEGSSSSSSSQSI